MLLDPLVHQRVGEHGLIALVVTKPAIAEDVDHDVFAELLAELSGHLGGVYHGLWVVAIHMENRGLNHQRVIRRIRRRAGEVRCGGKADLVVHNDMHRATGFVPTQPRQCETFGHNTLTSKRRVTVQQNRHYGCAFRVAQLVLLGADFAQYHRVHRL